MVAIVINSCLFLLISITFRISISALPVNFCVLSINGFFLLTYLAPSERPKTTTTEKDQVKKKVFPAPWRHWQIQDSPKRVSRLVLLLPNTRRAVINYRPKIAYSRQSRLMLWFSVSNILVLSWRRMQYISTKRWSPLARPCCVIESNNVMIFHSHFVI
jgi:hypothetical protein